MALNELEKLVANVVVLSATNANVQLTSDEVAPILKDATVEMAQPPISQVRLVSLREQITITLGGNQFIFTDESDAKPPKARVAEVVQSMTRLLATKNVQFRAYGYNFRVSFDSVGDTTASQLLQQRFLKSDIIQKRAGINTRGAGVKLFFEMGEAKCSLDIQPEGDSLSSPRFVAQINHHYDLPTGQFPQDDVLRSDFQGKWSTFTEMLEGLLYS